MKEGIRDDAVPGLPVGADRWPAESRLRELGREVGERLDPALAAEQAACGAWAAPVAEFLGGQSPESVAAALNPAFREAAAPGRLLGEGALELSSMCESIPHHEVEGLIQEASRAAAASPGSLLAALAPLDRRRMQEYVAFLTLAGRVLDQSLAALEGGENPAADPSAVVTDVSALLDQLDSHLQALTR